MSTAMAGDGPKFVPYHYTPNVAAAVIFIILFATATGAHLFSMFRLRAWYYIPFIVGGLFEIIGYSTRIYSHSHIDNIPAFAVQSTVLLVAPPLFAATIYMILGRIIRVLRAEVLSLVPLRSLTTIFVLSDVVCFLIQAGGGGLQASGNASSLKTGQDIVVAGLILQVAIFLVFVGTAWNFHARYSNQGSTSDLPWKRQMRALYAASLLITVRNIVRIVEYAQGFNGYIMSHEAFIYVFDAVLMLGVMVCLEVVHAGRFFKQAAGTRSSGHRFDAELATGMKAGEKR